MRFIRNPLSRAWERIVYSRRNNSDHTLRKIVCRWQGTGKSKKKKNWSEKHAEKSSGTPWNQNIYCKSIILIVDDWDDGGPRLLLVIRFSHYNQDVSRICNLLLRFFIFFWRGERGWSMINRFIICCCLRTGLTKITTKNLKWRYGVIHLFG